MTDFVNNPAGLTKAVMTPERRAQEEANQRGFNRLLIKMNKLGLSYNGEDAFVNSDGVACYDRYGQEIEQPVVEQEPESHVEDGPVPTIIHNNATEQFTRPSYAQGFIAPPIQQEPPAITVAAIVHQFKVYDPVQQQILITILNQ